jgi:hypothetical protein
MKTKSVENNLHPTNADFNRNGYWNRPILEQYTPKKSDIDLFDQNGYDLTELEKKYCVYNNTQICAHREYRFALKQEWFIQSDKQEGGILNHSLLFERKGYTGDALTQLQNWGKVLPLVYKIASIRPKWGLDFSMDWVDRTGNVLEVLHWEYDGFDIDEILNVKFHFERNISNIDWDDAGRKILKQKDQWYYLSFFEQSDWKCNFFGVQQERFKMVIWS